jgi:hypothetical protein
MRARYEMYAPWQVEWDQDCFGALLFLVMKKIDPRLKTPPRSSRLLHIKSQVNTPVAKFSSGNAPALPFVLSHLIARRFYTCIYIHARHGWFFMSCEKKMMRKIIWGQYPGTYTGSV